MLFTGAVIDVIFYEYIKITIIYFFECKQRPLYSIFLLLDIITMYVVLCMFYYIMFYMNKNEFALCNSMFKYFSSIMNEKRKCLFLAEMEVMFFSLPITFKYNLLYS